MDQQRVVEGSCQAMQVDFWPRSLPNCGMKSVLSRGWIAPWLSATSPRDDARQPWDAAELDISRCEFITGDALTELRKMPSATVNVIICSPPYWPVKRWYGGDGIGFQSTLGEYIRNLVGVFHEARRVLKNTGVLWTVIGDSFSRHGGKAKHQNGIGYQDAGRPPGNLLMISARLAMALQDSGSILRHDVVWDKGSVRPEAVTDRVTRTHEFAYMFAKNRRYFYDQDPLRSQWLVRIVCVVGTNRV